MFDPVFAPVAPRQRYAVPFRVTEPVAHEMLPDPYFGSEGET